MVKKGKTSTQSDQNGRIHNMGDGIMYTEHIMQIVLFEESCIFTVNEGSDGPGSSLFDIKSDRSDS